MRLCGNAVHLKETEWIVKDRIFLGGGGARKRNF